MLKKKSVGQVGFARVHTHVATIFGPGRVLAYRQYYDPVDYWIDYPWGRAFLKPECLASVGDRVIVRGRDLVTEQIESIAKAAAGVKAEPFAAAELSCNEEKTVSSEAQVEEEPSEDQAVSRTQLLHRTATIHAPAGFGGEGLEVSGSCRTWDDQVQAEAIQMEEEQRKRDLKESEPEEDILATVTGVLYNDGMLEVRFDRCREVETIDCRRIAKIVRDRESKQHRKSKWNVVREACQDGRLSLKDARAQLRWPDMDQLRALRDSIKKAVGKDDMRESIKQAIGEGDSGKSIWRFEDTGEEAGNAITEQSYSGVSVVDGSDCGVCGACDSDCNGMLPLPPVVDVI